MVRERGKATFRKRLERQLNEQTATKILARNQRLVKSGLFQLPEKPMRLREGAASALGPTTEPTRKFSTAFWLVLVQRQFVEDQWRDRPPLRQFIHQCSEL